MEDKGPQLPFRITADASSLSEPAAPLKKRDFCLDAGFNRSRLLTVNSALALAGEDTMKIESEPISSVPSFLIRGFSGAGMRILAVSRWMFCSQLENTS